MIGCIIQARMGSSRLPGKVMMEVNNKENVLDFVINQIKNAIMIDEIVVATSNLIEDKIIVEYLKKKNIKTFLGNPTDLLDRYFQCAKKFSYETIVRITADNPLIDPKIIDVVIKKIKNKEFDYVSNSLTRTFPHGTEVEVFSFNSLKDAWKNSRLPSEREHVTPYIKNHPEKFKIFNVENNENYSQYRWTVDHLNDLKLVRKITKRIESRPIFIQDIVELLKNEPELMKINESNIHNEGFLKSLKEDKEFLKYDENER
jgi:spore coat polysaccharide biosynthesis protein SpsF